jgi:hypothetical protein
MLVHSLFIESVDLFRLRRPSGGSNALGNRFDRCQFAPGEKKLGTLARKKLLLLCSSASFQVPFI